MARGRKATPLPERFHRGYNEDPDTKCWNWAKGFDKEGRPIIYNNEVHQNQLTKRVSYELRHSIVPDGLIVESTCANLKCVNPSHLRTLTRSLNIEEMGVRMGPRKRKTACIHGHNKTPDNSYVGKDGLIVCKPCSRERQKKAYHARKAKVEANKAHTLGYSPVERLETHFKCNHLRGEENTYYVGTDKRAICKQCKQDSQRKTYKKRVMAIEKPRLRKDGLQWNGSPASMLGIDVTGLKTDAEIVNYLRGETAKLQDKPIDPRRAADLARWAEEDRLKALKQ